MWLICAGVGLAAAVLHLPIKSDRLEIDRAAAADGAGGRHAEESEEKVEP
jgi:hypothetical protein